MKKIKVAAKAFVLKDNNILLIKRSLSQTEGKIVWDIPGGGIEEGESFEDALHREIMEEVGLKVKICDTIRAWNFKQEDGMTYGISFLTKYLSSEIKLSDEHEDYKWVKINLCQEMDIDDWIKDEAKVVAARLKDV